ncbi:putative glucosamine-fructose-6-phosphate aminotransferase [Trypanosoma conorhini]|uniref:Putative glucosamine-fructose-6-phosphate aminotransferase n=1 Tax=Trypanosoma conorhini TaxID=83891 RepID=A0A3R7NA70_9TRYP|nr:putative glucosamine-fructose-6-phosphate aminotransferase [Trypanosoma conorhini]RNF15526.1 putative glucosamine-fructose-6-phosphate aminotransferase [Trypanosoma conorhini]
MSLFCVRVVLLVSLLFPPSSCAAAWSLWLTSPSRPAAATEADAAAAPAPGGSHRRVQLPPRFSSRQNADARHGQQAAQLLREWEEKGRISSCWKRAVEALKEDCGSLRSDDGARSRLAMAMAACDAAADGGRRAWPHCTSETGVRRCVDHLDDAQYLVYVQYRLHTDVLCLYIQEEAFQERTEMAVQALYAGAAAASEALAALQSSSSELQDSVQKAADQQASNLVATRHLHDQLRELRSDQTVAFESLQGSAERIVRSLADASLHLNELHLTLDESTAQAAAAVRDVAREATEFQRRTELHASSMLNVLGRIESFQRGLLESAIGLGEMVRAAALLVVLLLLTLPPRTAAARRPCVGVVALAYALRPFLLPAPRSVVGNNAFFAAVIFLAAVTLVFFACTYRSPEHALRALLRSELRHFMDDTRPAFLEDIRQLLGEGVAAALQRLDEEKDVQRLRAKGQALLLAAAEAATDEAHAPAAATKAAPNVTRRRSRSRPR